MRRRDLLRWLARLTLAASLPGCGFRLRGDAHLPFKTLYISGADGSALANELRRTLREQGSVQVASDPRAADAVLHLMANSNEKVILSLSGGGRVREFLLTQRVVFRVLGKGNEGEWLAPTEINVRRDFSYNDSIALAKEHEERTLWRDMQADAVGQILRRLSVVRPPA